MTDTALPVEDEGRIRRAVSRDGLLDIHIGSTLLLAFALGALGWRLMGNPGVFAALPAIFVPQSLQRLRRRQTYPRLGCEDYRGESERRFALLVLTVLALLGLIVFITAALVGRMMPSLFWSLVPVWLALGTAGLLGLLAWWYRATRYLWYGVTVLASVALGYLGAFRPLVKLALVVGVTGLVMVAFGATTSQRFRRSNPLPGGRAAES